MLSAYGLPTLTNEEAWLFYQALFADARIAFADEPAGIEGQWRRLSGVATASPKLWMDAYLAAFAIAGGFQFVTFDRAFAQFQGLDLELLSTTESRTCP